MRILKAIWNLHPDPARYRALGARALRGLAFFLGLMLCFTLVSRAADSMTVATVSTTSTSRGALIHTFKLDGSVEAVDSVPVLVPSGVLVESLAVSQGDTVSAGDLLLTYDPSQVQHQLSTGYLELQKLQLQMEDLQAEQERTAGDSEQALDRAAEDLDIAIARAEANLYNASADRARARRELSNYDGDDEAEEEALRDAYRAAQRAYEQALLDQTETLTRYQRALEDAEGEPGSLLTMQSLAIDIQLKQMELAWLQESIDASGRVYAPADGVVGELNTAPGRTTGGEAALYLTDTGSLRVTATVDADQKKALDLGAGLTLKADGTDKLSGLEVRSILPVEGESGRWALTLDLPEDTALSPNRTVELEVTRRTETYDSCVSLSALYQEGQSYYLLVLDQTDTVTGEQTVARRVDITLLDHNDSLAAVSGAVGSGERIISSSSKLLAPGDRVRLAG